MNAKDASPDLCRIRGLRGPSSWRSGDRYGERSEFVRNGIICIIGMPEPGIAAEDGTRANRWPEWAGQRGAVREDILLLE